MDPPTVKVVEVLIPIVTPVEPTTELLGPLACVNAVLALDR